MRRLTAVPVLLCFFQMHASAWASLPVTDGVYEAHLPNPGNQANQDEAHSTVTSKQVVSDSGLGVCRDTRTEFWKANTCEFLFSPQVPPIVAAQGIPQKNWFPVCSISLINDMRPDCSSDVPADGSVDKSAETEAVTAADDIFRNLDRCTRDTPSASSSHQVTPKVRVKSKEQRIDFMETVYRYKHVVEAACCASDKSGYCTEYFEAAPAWYCDYRKGADAYRDCIKHGTKTSFTNKKAYKQFFKEYKSAASGRGHFPLNSGYIQFEPFTAAAQENDTDPQYVEDTDLDILHEWSHVCSAIRRQIMVEEGDAAAYFELKTHLHDYRKDGTKAEGCSISQDVIDAYQRTFSALGVEQNVFACVLETAKTAPKARFTEDTCSRGCERHHLEEGFAELMSLYLSPVAQLAEYLNGDGSLDFCQGSLRDDVHPLFLDILTCAMKSPTFQAKMKSVMQCR